MTRRRPWRPQRSPHWLAIVRRIMRDEGAEPRAAVVAAKETR